MLHPHNFYNSILQQNTIEVSACKELYLEQENPAFLTELDIMYFTLS